MIEKPKKKATQKEPVQPEQDNRSEPVDDPAAKAPAPVRRSAPGRVLGAANYTAAEIEGSSPLLTLLCVLSLSQLQYSSSRYLRRHSPTWGTFMATH